MSAIRPLSMGLAGSDFAHYVHFQQAAEAYRYGLVQRLNMLPKMQKSRFVKKHSVQFVNASGKLSAPFYFQDNKPHECSQTWQVVRSEFDQMMLDNAREHIFDGLVIDERTGKPIPNAEVAILGRPGAVYTDAEGRFTWKPTPALPFEVLVILPGER